MKTYVNGFSFLLLNCIHVYCEQVVIIYMLLLING